MANKYLQRVLLAVTAVAATTTIVACGGDPAPGGDTTGSTVLPRPLAALELTASPTALDAQDGKTSTVTVTAVDASRRALADVPVNLSASSGILSGTSTTTDASGKLTATFTLGADQANRNVDIRASSGNIASNVTIAVQGTTTAVTASPSTAQTAATPIEISASVTNAAKVALGGVGVSFSTTGGTLSSASAVTDATGTAKVTLTGVTSTVRVTATAANASATVDVQAGSTANPNPIPTGVAIKNIAVQVNPSVVGPNPIGSTASFSQLDVRVTGDLGAALGIPVGYAPVRLRIGSAPAFGTLSIDTTTSAVLTNESGTVSARFIPGSATTGTDGVVICASVDGLASPPGGGVAPCAANEVAAKLTISQAPLFIRISYNNEIAKVNNNLDYEKQFSIYVTDAAGKGVAGVPVSVRLQPLQYLKGYMVIDTTANSWVYALGFPVACENEDRNFNGVLDSGDVDLNDDKLLWPGQSAAFTLDSNGVTDSAGFVNLKVRHGQRFALWATYQIEARASTAGTERATTVNYTLSAAADDVKKIDSTPGFAISPFGVANVCTNPN